MKLIVWQLLASNVLQDWMVTVLTLLNSHKSCLCTFGLSPTYRCWRRWDTISLRTWECIKPFPQTRWDIARNKQLRSPAGSNITSMLLTSCKCRSYSWWVVVFLSCNKYGKILTNDRNLLSLLFSRSYGCSANEIFRLAQRKFIHENITWTIVACAAFVILMFHLISCRVYCR